MSISIEVTDLHCLAFKVPFEFMCLESIFNWPACSQAWCVAWLGLQPGSQLTLLCSSSDQWDERLQWADLFFLQTDSTPNIRVSTVCANALSPPHRLNCTARSAVTKLKLGVMTTLELLQGPYHFWRFQHSMNVELAAMWKLSGCAVDKGQANVWPKVLHVTTLECALKGRLHSIVNKTTPISRPRQLAQYKKYDISSIMSALG